MAANWSVRPEPDGARRVVVAGELDLADEETFVADVDALVATRVTAPCCSISTVSTSSIRAGCGRSSACIWINPAESGWSRRPTPSLGSCASPA